MVSPSASVAVTVPMLVWFSSALNVEDEVNVGALMFSSISFIDTVNVISELLRVGKKAIVTIPNFGYWKVRIHLLFKGTMPVTENLPNDWYNTPNIHFCTVKDFEKLCASRDITIKSKSMIAGSKFSSFLASLWPNLFALTAIYRLAA